ncbi:MAG: lysostaphin resistance A-like protein [Cellulosilyticaceae bacterium]
MKQENISVMKLIGISVLMVFFLEIVIGSFNMAWGENFIRNEILIRICYVGPLAYIFYKSKQNNVRINNAFKPLNLKKDILFIIVIGILQMGISVTSLCLLALVLFKTNVITVDQIYHILYASPTQSLSHTYLIIEIIGSVLIAPIAEEIIFRMAIFGSLKNRYTIIYSVAVTSFLFYIGHGIHRIDAFLLGILLCIIYHKSQNLWLPILIHTLNNLVSMSARIKDST